MRNTKYINPKYGFTLLEMMIVTVAISVLTAVAIPNYNKAVEKSYYRDALLNINTIKGAAEISKAINNTWIPVGGRETITSLADINSLFDLKIKNDHFDYSYKVERNTYLEIKVTRNNIDNTGFAYQFTHQIDYATSLDKLACDPCPSWH